VQPVPREADFRLPGEPSLFAEGGGSLIEAHAAERIVLDDFGDCAGGIREDVRAAEGIIVDVVVELPWI
jgi:hypothetical protein